MYVSSNQVFCSQAASMMFDICVFIAQLGVAFAKQSVLINYVLNFVCSVIIQALLLRHRIFTITVHKVFYGEDSQSECAKNHN